MLTLKRELHTTNEERMLTYVPLIRNQTRDPSVHRPLSNPLAI